MINFLLSWAFLVVPLTVYSGVINVCKSCPVKEIAQAIDLSQGGDSIIFLPGIYEAVDISIHKRIHLLGNTGVVFDGLSKSYMLKIYADSVSVSGIEFVHSGKSYTKDFAAIYISKSEHFRIENCKIVNPFFGILIEKSHYGKIIGNVISGSSLKEDDSGNGIHLWHCSKMEVKGNEVVGLRDGIYFEFVSESEVAANHSHDNVRYGLHFMFSNNDKYFNNIFENNGAGVAVMFSKFITMKENKFVHNWGTASYGLLLKEIYDAEIEHNNFEQNTTGIFIEGCTRINYSNNDFQRNGWAVKIAGACYTNKFFNNNFLYNAFDVSYNSKLNDNEFNNNYWSSYSGYDLDRNGIGDVPYRPVKLFSYIVNETPETIVLLRSFFIDIINFSEKVSPVFTPDALVDAQPLMTFQK